MFSSFKSVMNNFVVQIREFIKVINDSGQTIINEINPQELNHTNNMNLYLTTDKDNKNIALIAQFDNLGKGASRQALQTVSIVIGEDEQLANNKEIGKVFPGFLTSSAMYVAPSHPLKAKKEYLNAAPIANTVCHPKSLGQKESVKWLVLPVENPVKVIPIIAPTAITLVAPKTT